MDHETLAQRVQAWARRQPRAVLIPVAFIATSSAHADEPVTPAAEPTPAGPATETTSTPIVELHGFVDGSLFAPISGYAPGSRGVVLGVDQVELDVIAKPHSRLAIRMDLNWFPAYGDVSFDALVEQARVDLELGAGWFLRFGKLNAPRGIETSTSVLSRR